MRRCVLVALLALAACGRLIPANNQTLEPTRLEGGAYRLDPDHIALLWKINHLGFSQFVGRFDRVEASLDFDPGSPTASRLEVIVETASIDTNVPKLDDDLRGSGWLDATAFPQAIFRSTAIDVTGRNTGRVTGDLTLHGVTRPISLDVTFNGGANDLITGRYTLGFAAAGTFKRSEFGIDSLIPAIGDEIELEIHAEFLRQ
ncbi:MAG: YceI family protein [Geminicoccaceae bacterium]